MWKKIKKIEQNDTQKRKLCQMKYFYKRQKKIYCQCLHMR